jgi:hypothetical protein
LADHLGRGPAFVALVAEMAQPGASMPGERATWSERFEVAAAALDAQAQALDRGLSRDHGMELGM